MAKEYLDFAANHIGEVQNLYTEALYYNQVGTLKQAQGKLDEAILNYEKSASIYKKFSLGVDLSNVLGNLIKLYGNNNSKYLAKKAEAYELYFDVLKNIDRGNGQKILLRQKYEEDLKINEAKYKLQKQLKEEKNKAEKNKQRLILTSTLVVLMAVLIFVFFIVKALHVNKQKNKIISEQKIEVEQQKQLIEEKHKDITDSITYAHRIQSSLIPPQSQINKTFKNISLFFQPRDIVSGDFYWISKINDTIIFALADCTGHGVPGAFMSIIGINQLNTLVNEKGITQLALILNELKKGIINSLNSSADSDKKDGMDIALISFGNKQLNFAGANQSIYILREKELIELKGNKQPIGLSDNNEDFTEIKFELIKGDRLILYSDGLVDQFGGEEGKKLKSKNLKIWLIESSNLSLEDQKELIANKLNTFKQNYEQTDDITLAIIEI